MRKKQRWLFASLCLFLPILTGCASFTGFASEYYDGHKISRNEETIAAYKNLEILGEQKDAHFTASIKRFLSQPSLPLHEEETYSWLSTTPRVVGDDFPEGRYHVFNNGRYPNDNFIVRDDNNEVIYQQVLGGFMAGFELDLFDGQIIEGGRDEDDAGVVLLDAELYQEISELGYYIPPTSQVQGGIPLHNGVWHVGEHLPAGSYQAHFVSAFSQKTPLVYVLRADGETRLFELRGPVTHSFEEQLPEVTIELDLAEGDVLLIENSVPLTFVPK